MTEEGGRCDGVGTKQIHQSALLPELQGTPSSLAAGSCVMLTHSLRRPGRIKMQREQPGDDVR